MSTDVDFLIVGQGLAGSVLAWELMQQQQTVRIVDPAGSSASRVAAGLVNPVTGKRLVKTSGIDTYLPVARQTYRQLEQDFGQSFFFERSLVRLFQSEDERAVWARRKADPDYQPYLGEQFLAGQGGRGFSDALGGFRQKQCAYLDTVALLNGFKDFFLQQGVLIKDTLPLTLINPERFPLHWQGLVCRHVIFCEGWRGMHNPWFFWLPFQPAKGDILTLRIDVRLPDNIISKKHWLIPLTDGHFRFGSSYQWSPLNEQLYEATREQLLNGLTQLFEHPMNWQCLQQQSGIRPGTKDRSPFLGIHPQFPALSIFNGFGAKGVSLIPWYAKQFVDSLLKHKPVPVAGDILRYY